MSILSQNAITKSLFFGMGLTPPPFFLNNVKKTADLEKRYIPKACVAKDLDMEN